MTLLENQIKHLFVWVHPHNHLVHPDVLQEWQTLVELLVMDHPIMRQCALVQLSPSFADADISKLVEQKARNIPAYARERVQQAWRTQYEALAYTEMLARETLGERYLLWTHGGFIDARKPEHVEALKRQFNVTERQWNLPPEESYRDLPKLFRTIHAYGLREDVCVDKQLDEFGGYLIGAIPVTLLTTPITVLSIMAEPGKGDLYAVLAKLAKSHKSGETENRIAV